MMRIFFGDRFRWQKGLAKERFSMNQVQFLFYTAAGLSLVTIGIGLVAVPAICAEIAALWAEIDEKMRQFQVTYKCVIND